MMGPEGAGGEEKKGEAGLEGAGETTVTGEIAATAETTTTGETAATSAESAGAEKSSE